MAAQRTRVAVLGGSSGIGRATAVALAKAGSSVVVAGRDADRLKAVEADADSITAATVDATDRSQLDRFFADHGPFDDLVVCVTGGGGAGQFAALDLNEVARGLAAKTLAQLLVVQAALPFLTDRASVTLVTAASADAALPGTAGLAAINGALEAAVRPLASELAPRRVNAVSPGVVDTAWWNWMPRDQRDEFFRQTAERLPAGRIANADDIARAITFLIDCPAVTGHVIVADGGAHLAR